MTPRQRSVLVLPAMALSALVIALVLPQAPRLQPPGTMDSPASTPAIRLTLAPPQPQSAEPEATPEPPSEVTPQPPEPIPAPPEPAVEPEPVVREPEPVVREPEPSVAEPKPPTTEPAPAVAEPTPAASPEPATETQPAPTTVALLAGQSTATDNYLGQLMRHLGRHFVYPRRAQRLGQEGTPIVLFSFDRSGTLLEWRLQEGSSYTLLDQAALDLLKAAEPLPAIPDDMSGSRFSFTLPVRFHLR